MNCHTKLSHSDSFLLARPSHQPHYEAIQNHPSDPPPPPGSRKKGGAWRAYGLGAEGKDFLFAHSALIVWKINTSAVWHNMRNAFGVLLLGNLEISAIIGAL